MRVESKHMHPGLRKYINHIAFNNFLPDDCKNIRVLPDSMSELVINVGKAYERTTPNGKELISVTGSHYTGIKSSFCFIRPNLDMKKLSIRFKPGAISFFTRNSAHEFSDGIVDAREIFGKEIKELEKELEGCKDEEELIKKTELFLLEKLTINTHAIEAMELARSIYLKPSTTKIENIKGGFTNYKHLERRFLKYLGLMPKHFMKIVRFNYSTKIKLSNPQLSLTQVAYIAGYSDQSHFIRNFKQFAGQTPKEYYPDFPLMNANQMVINSLFD